MDAEILKIIGTLITALLGLNAYFFKTTTSRLSQISLELVKIATQHNILAKMLDSHDSQITDLRDKSSDLSTSISVLKEIKFRIKKAEDDIEKIQEHRCGCKE